MSRKIDGTGIADDRGQAMTEHALVTAACVAALLAVLSVFLTVTVNYYEDIMYLVGLPFP
jgi:Flp pilus assembly pilin Flp